MEFLADLHLGVHAAVLGVRHRRDDRGWGEPDRSRDANSHGHRARDSNPDGLGALVIKGCLRLRTGGASTDRVRTILDGATPMGKEHRSDDPRSSYRW